MNINLSSLLWGIVSTEHPPATVYSDHHSIVLAIDHVSIDSLLKYIINSNEASSCIISFHLFDCHPLNTCQRPSSSKRPRGHLSWGMP
ncbi:hypothetical protein VTN77DRAFT_6257 [Rasamsonia byssochlamydoides]|uniref:uncharacterized protein n=1 Tax=Rasamsonia byssochlamydoides TaxID=89139 RepID=UPI0037445D9B